MPVATIKFYLRERLLPPGEPTARNQAAYSETHLRRLRMIKVFTNIGQLDLMSVRELLTAVDNDQLPLPALYDVVNRVLVVSEDPAPGETQSVQSARADVDGLIDELGWRVRQDAHSRAHLAHVLAALRRLGCDCKMDFFTTYVEAAERLATQELDLLSPDEPDRAATVVRNVLLEVAFAAIRRLAQEHHVALRFGQPPAAGGAG